MFTASYIFISERRTIADYVWMLTEVQTDVRRHAKNHNDGLQMRVHAVASDSDAALMDALKEVPLTGNSKRALCELHVKVSLSLRTFNAIVKSNIFTAQRCPFP